MGLLDEGEEVLEEWPAATSFREHFARGFQSTLGEGFGFGILALGTQQEGEVGQGEERFDILGAELALAFFERAAMGEFCFGRGIYIARSIRGREGVDGIGGIELHRRESSGGKGVWEAGNGAGGQFGIVLFSF